MNWTLSIGLGALSALQTIPDSTAWSSPLYGVNNTENTWYDITYQSYHTGFHWGGWRNVLVAWISIKGPTERGFSGMLSSFVQILYKEWNGLDWNWETYKNVTCNYCHNVTASENCTDIFFFNQVLFRIVEQVQRRREASWRMLRLMCVRIQIFMILCCCTFLSSLIVCKKNSIIVSWVVETLCKIK